MPVELPGPYALAEELHVAGRLRLISAKIEIDMLIDPGIADNAKAIVL